jgi:pimeloyl-ACP methyl ester carboxylesterase
MKNLYYGWASPLSWVMLGYAVVAPDYAGLGSRVPHEYLALQAQAQDVIHAIPAARNAVKELGSRWVAIGHSQGGCTVLRVSELQGEIKDANYLGTVAIAPGGDYEPIVEYLHGTQDRGLIGFLAYGIKSVYPDFEYRSFLTPEALEFMPTIQDGGIFVTLTAFAEKVPAGKLLRPEWKKNEYYQKFRMLNVSGEKPAFRQVLLLHGEDDEVIPTNTMDDLHERMKKQKSMVEYKKYPALAHDPLLYGSFRDQVRWVQDRFDSK